MQVTSRILYLIYIGLSAIMFVILLLLPDKKMTVFDSFITTFGTAGTGGFSNHSASIGFYDPCIPYTVSIFMIIFGINFSVYYLILIGHAKDAFKNEEVIWYLILIVLATTAIFFNIRNIYTSEEAFRHSLFQTASIISTTGFATVDYAIWPGLSLIIIMFLTMIGSCAGSTAGGLKVSRFAIITKSMFVDIEKMISPRKVRKIRMNFKPLDDNLIHSVKSFFITYFLLLMVCAILVSIYNPSMPNLDPLTSFTSSLTCISNVGPGLGLVGPSGNFSGYSYFSKMVLSLEMIAGRLEIFPILILFSSNTWKKRI